MSGAGMSDAGMSGAAIGSTGTARRAVMPAGRSGLRGSITMEWIKLRSVRSTWWTLAIALAGMVGLAILILANISGHWATMSVSDRASFDPTNAGFTGVALAQLAMVVFGIMAVTSEYSSGMIRSTLAATPRRGLMLAAKAAVVGAIAVVVGEVGAFAAFLVGQAFLASPAPHATLGQPGVLRAVVLAGAYLTLTALMGLGIGLLVRRAAAAISVAVGLIFVLPPLTLALPDSMQHALQRFLPEVIAENSLTNVLPDPFALSAWTGLGMLCLYTAVLLGAGAVLLCRRDA